jgi:hypothetical protein
MKLEQQTSEDKDGVNRFFTAIPGKTKEIRVGWHDYEDERSLDRIIHIPLDQDPEGGATSFLMEYVPHQYDLEFAKEHWRIGIYPVREGPGSGDGSDDVTFRSTVFEGSKQEAENEGLLRVFGYVQEHGSSNPDLGSYDVVYDVTVVS